MPQQARVTSIEALEAFRTALIIYLEKAGRVLDEISDDVTRTRLWLENDRRAFWENQIKRRGRDLEEKQQALFSAKLSGLRDMTPMEQNAVREAKSAITEAEAKARLIKSWTHGYDNKVAVVSKEVDKLRDLLDRDMGKAVMFLAQAIKTLDAYAEIAPAAADAPSSPTPAADAATDTEKGAP